jgi:hypothetical protein
MPLESAQMWITKATQGALWTPFQILIIYPPPFVACAYIMPMLTPKVNRFGHILSLHEHVGTPPTLSLFFD